MFNCRIWKQYWNVARFCSLLWWLSQQWTNPGYWNANTPALLCSAHVWKDKPEPGENFFSDQTLIWLNLVSLNQNPPLDFLQHRKQPMNEIGKKRPLLQPQVAKGRKQLAGVSQPWTLQKISADPSWLCPFYNLSSELGGHEEGWEEEKNPQNIVTFSC